MRNISQTVRDIELVSTEGHYKVPYRLSKKGEIFDLRWPWKVKNTNRNFRCGISCKRYKIKSLYQQNIIIKSHMGFLIKLKYFDLGWPWKVKVTNRNLRCGISRKRYEIESLYQQNIIIKSHMGFLKKLKYLTLGDPESHTRALQKNWKTWPLVTLKGQGH